MKPSMFIPAPYQMKDRSEAHRVMRENSFATLVSLSARGECEITPLPIQLDPDRGPVGTMIAHLARASPHAGAILRGDPVVAIFSGPHAYISPMWYESPAEVPTWNYVTVHAHGVPIPLASPAAVRLHLNWLAKTYEWGRSEPWTPAHVGEETMERLSKAILAFEVPIAKLEGKAKLGQNRSQRDRRGVIEALRNSSDSLERGVAELMETTLRNPTHAR